MIWFFGKKKIKEEVEEIKKTIEEKVESKQTLSVAPSSSVPDTSKKYVVRYEWKKCIGSAVCEAVCPAHWKVENGKAILIGSKLIDENEKIYEKEITEAELDCNRMAADGCPPNCIHVINLQTGEEIAPKK